MMMMLKTEWYNTGTKESNSVEAPSSEDDDDDAAENRVV